MKPRDIHVRHEPGASESVIGILRTERELQKLIDGEAEVDPTQLHSLEQRLQVIIADYLESGSSLGIVLKPTEILSALEAAIQEAAGNPSPWPDGADARTFFIHGLYDEIIQQPSNIFETKRFPDGSTRYVPVGRAIWKACLQQLRQHLLTAG